LSHFGEALGRESRSLGRISGAAKAGATKAGAAKAQKGNSPETLQPIRIVARIQFRRRAWFETILVAAAIKSSGSVLRLWTRYRFRSIRKMPVRTSAETELSRRPLGDAPSAGCEYRYCVRPGAGRLEARQTGPEGRICRRCSRRGGTCSQTSKSSALSPGAAACVYDFFL
jgi:hypothetical protein